MIMLPTISMPFPREISFLSTLVTMALIINTLRKEIFKSPIAVFHCSNKKLQNNKIKNLHWKAKQIVHLHFCNKLILCFDDNRQVNLTKQVIRAKLPSIFDHALPQLSFRLWVKCLACLASDLVHWLKGDHARSRRFKKTQFNH